MLVAYFKSRRNYIYTLCTDEFSRWPFEDTTVDGDAEGHVWSVDFDPRPLPVAWRPLPRTCFFLCESSKLDPFSVFSVTFILPSPAPWVSHNKQDLQRIRLINTKEAKSKSQGTTMPAKVSQLAFLIQHIFKR